MKFVMAIKLHWLSSRLTGKYPPDQTPLHRQNLRNEYVFNGCYVYIEMLCVFVCVYIPKIYINDSQESGGTMCATHSNDQQSTVECVFIRVPRPFMSITQSDDDIDDDDGNDFDGAGKTPKCQPASVLQKSVPKHSFVPNTIAHLHTYRNLLSDKCTLTEEEEAELVVRNIRNVNFSIVVSSHSSQSAHTHICFFGGTTGHWYICMSTNP